MTHQNKLFSGLRRRLAFAFAGARLEAAFALARRTVWVDKGYLWLPYHGHVDKQEIFYHLHGAAWWKAEGQRLGPHVRPGAVAVDVGANIGFITALLAGLCGPSGRVFSFEPSPTTFAKLKEVLERNKIENATAYNAGCGATPAEMSLHLAGASGNSSLRPNAAARRDSEKTERVRIEVLDQFLEPHLSRLDFLKIDTEGFEDQVLLGCRNLLRKFQPVVYIEFSAEYRESSTLAVDFLKSEGYRFETEPDLGSARTGENFIVRPGM